ncbi:hypothetical protein QKW35_07920 [Pontibacterium granulatum]|uniref:hypothetical protein n=1 Tax=Pontibacterium granulatum TaxID=2036029 RepID=UPI00249AA12A|nr:hypothetical protein [Pontibacterium granulatum]MDI3324302.1 hypothetical protein [Pontibacterium granulatum]
MKKLMCAALLGFGMVSAPAMAWECTAASPSAWGVGYSAYRGTAARIALNECAIRTPWGQACYIQQCYNYRSAETEQKQPTGGMGKPEYLGEDEDIRFNSDPEETAGGVLKNSQ